MQSACARRQVRRARFFLVEISLHAILTNKTFPVRGGLPKLIILSVAFRRAVARIDSWTLKPISHPSNDTSLEILNSPFTKAPLRVTNINFHLLSTIDVSRRWKPCQSSSVDIIKGIQSFVRVQKIVHWEIYLTTEIVS